MKFSWSLKDEENRKEYASSIWCCKQLISLSHKILVDSLFINIFLGILFLYYFIELFIFLHSFLFKSTIPGVGLKYDCILLAIMWDLLVVYTYSP